MKIKVFTHGSDLDGMGCAFLLRNAYGKDNVDISYVEYKNINSELYKFLREKEATLYDKVFITDISISENMAEWINTYETYRKRFVLLDHHIGDSTNHLLKYNWCTVQGNKPKGELCSGTWLVSEWINNNLNLSTTPYLEDIITSIDRYDTWLWKNKYNGYIPSKELNDLFHIIGRDNLLIELENKINNSKFEISEMYRQLLQLKEDKYKITLENCNKYMQRLVYNDYTIGVVYVTEYISELGNDLAKLNQDVDFVALANLTTGFISFRGIKNHVHLGNFAKELGELIGNKGGGHPLSAGISLDLEFKNNILLSIFKNGKFILNN